MLVRFSLFLQHDNTKSFYSSIIGSVADSNSTVDMDPATACAEQQTAVG